MIFRMRLLRLVCDCTHTAECGDVDKVRDTAAASEGWQCQDEEQTRDRPPLYRFCTLSVQLPSSDYWKLKGQNMKNFN